MPERLRREDINDICKSYRESRNQDEQIMVLSQLYACSVEQMADILLREGLVIEMAGRKSKYSDAFILQVYEKNNRSLERTATELEMSVSNLSYRLRKIREHGQKECTVVETTGQSEAGKEIEKAKEKEEQEMMHKHSVYEQAEQIEREKKKDSKESKGGVTLARKSENKQEPKEEATDLAKEYDIRESAYIKTYERLDSILSELRRTDSKDTIDGTLALATSLLRDAAYVKLGKKYE